MAMKHNKEQLDLFSFPEPTGKDLRDAGIRKAINHANKKDNNWSEKAYNFLINFIRSNSEFMVEDVRKASDGVVDEPPSLRAWGSIIVRASKEKLIKRVGFRNVSNAKAHATPASVWIKNETINQ